MFWRTCPNSEQRERRNEQRSKGSNGNACGLLLSISISINRHSPFFLSIYRYSSSFLPSFILNFSSIIPLSFFYVCIYVCALLLPYRSHLYVWAYNRKRNRNHKRVGVSKRRYLVYVYTYHLLDSSSPRRKNTYSPSSGISTNMLKTNTANTQNTADILIPSA